MTPELLASCETAAATGDTAFEVSANATNHQSRRSFRREAGRL